MIKWLLILLLPLMVMAEPLTIDESGAILARSQVPVLRYKSSGRTIVCYLHLNDVLAGEWHTVTSTVALSNWNKETVGNTLYIEECVNRSCIRAPLMKKPGNSWLDGGNITASMNHAVYQPSAKEYNSMYMPRKTYAVSVASYSTGALSNPNLRVDVGECDINVERRRP